MISDEENLHIASTCSEANPNTVFPMISNQDMSKLIKVAKVVVLYIIEKQSIG